jgi:hypothetical protein
MHMYVTCKLSTQPNLQPAPVKSTFSKILGQRLQTLPSTTLLSLYTVWHLQTGPVTQNPGFKSGICHLLDSYPWAIFIFCGFQVHHKIEAIIGSKTVVKDQMLLRRKQLNQCLFLDCPLRCSCWPLSRLPRDCQENYQLLNHCRASEYFKNHHTSS